jgi:hypothetical protein
MKEILSKHQEELRIFKKDIFLLEQNIKNNAKEKNIIEYNLKQLE